MASTFDNDLRLEEMATGENAGSWGTKTNTNLELIADAFGYGTFTIADADTTLEIPEGSGTDNALRSMYLKISSSADLTTTRVLTLAPNTISKLWYIENNTSGGQTITISQGSGANVSIQNGQAKLIATDGAGAGAAVIDATQDLAIPDLFVDSNLTVGGDLTVDTNTLYVDSTNNRVAMGSTSPQERLLINEASDTIGVTLAGTANAANTAVTGGLGFRNLYSATTGHVATITTETGSGTALGDLIFSTSSGSNTPSEAMRIDSSQRVFIGGTSSVSMGSTHFHVQMQGDSFATTSNAIQRYEDNAAGGMFAFAKSRNGTIGSQTIVQDGDEIGKIRWYGSNGSNFTYYAAQINAEVDGTPGTGADMPGRIIFSTTSDGSGSPNERMRINNAGDVSIGTSADPTVRLDIAYSDATNYGIKLKNTDTTITAKSGITMPVSNGTGGGAIYVDSAVSSGNGNTYDMHLETFQGASNIIFEPTGTEAMRINASQRVLIGGDTDFAVAGRERLLVEHTDGGGISMRRLDSTVVAGDVLGRLNFYGSDGASVGNDGIGAAIVAKAAGTFAANDFPTNLAFFTNVDNAENLVENLTIRYDGHVGINDTQPSTILSVKDDNTLVQIAANGGTEQSYFIANANRPSATQHIAELIGQWNGTSVGRIVIAAGDDTTNKDDGEMTFYTAPAGAMTRRMVIRNNGNIGIGNDVGIDPVNPSNFGTALEIGDNDGGSLVLTDTNTTTNKKSFFLSSKGTKFNLGTMNDDGSGDAGILFLDHTTQHVGIGTDDPDTLFAVYDDTTWDTTTFKSNTGTGAGFTMHSTSTGVEWSLIAQGTAGGADDNNLGFHLTNAGTSGQAAGYKFAMNASGDFKIFNGNLNMATAGTGIDFSAQTATSASGATTDSEILDHYEEGDWTPTLKGATTTGSVTGYTARVGWYTRIGNIVQIHCTIAANGFTGTGPMIIDGLPFNVSSASVDSVFSMQWNSAQWSGPSSTKQTVIPMIYATSAGKIGFRASDYQSGGNFAQVNCVGSSSTISYMRITGWYRLGTT